jgi:ACR3 family arsenite efflux pump ArsB
VAGIITRYTLIWAYGEKWYNEKFMAWFGPVALISLIYTIIVLFSLQGHQVCLLALTSDHGQAFMAMRCECHQL